jgi:hypothetical protein
MNNSVCCLNVSILFRYSLYHLWHCLGRLLDKFSMMGFKIFVHFFLKCIECFITILDMHTCYLNKFTMVIALLLLSYVVFFGLFLWHHFLQGYFHLQGKLYTIMEICRIFDGIYKEHLDGMYVSFIQHFWPDCPSYSISEKLLTPLYISYPYLYKVPNKIL